MSGSKFTKSAWTKTGQFTVKIGDDEAYLTTQQTGDYFAPDTEREANACLIAAAPEMYKFLDDLAHGRGTDYPIQMLLTKARGEL